MIAVHLKPITKSVEESDIQKAILDYLRLRRCRVSKDTSVGIMKRNGS